MIFQCFAQDIDANFVHSCAGTHDASDLPSCPLSQPAKSWMWLVDLERVCALLIGRSLGGMLVGSPMSSEERETTSWILSPLFAAGLHKYNTDLGVDFSTRLTMWRRRFPPSHVNVKSFQEFVLT